MVALARDLENQNDAKSGRMVVEAKRLDHTIPALQSPRICLRLSDVSDDGISAISDRPVATGEHVGINFSTQANQRPWDVYGRVVRCEPSEIGYRLAVEFDLPPAA